MVFESRKRLRSDLSDHKTETFTKMTTSTKIKVKCEDTRKQNGSLPAMAETSKRQRKGSKGETDMAQSSQHNMRGETVPDESKDAHSLDPKGPESPDAFLIELLRSEYGLQINKGGTTCQTIPPGFFDVISEQEMTSYTAVVGAARANNILDISTSLAEGHSLNCCNRFGESLLHIACRRGFVEMTRLILDQPGARTRLVDDCGRTPLHDLCWNPSPQLEICRWILEKEPSLFLLRDKRNFTPFDYARQEHWEIWKEFILENKALFKKLDSDCYNFLKCGKDIDTFQPPLDDEKVDVINVNMI